jgi:hypothetical protein
MESLSKILPQIEGSHVIQQCWGEIPSFELCEVLHLTHVCRGLGISDIGITALFVTNDPDKDYNESKPSKMVLEITGVTHFEYDNGVPERNGIKLSDVFSRPPQNGMRIVAFGGFRVVCQSIRLLSCIHDPFTPLDDIAV